MKADFHIHSTVSDGSDSIERIIEIAKIKGLDAIAITDHDTMSHASQIPSEPNIKIFTGVEISAIHRETGKRAHILGYKIKRPEIITALTQPLLEARNNNTEKQALILIKAGFKIDMDKLTRADGKYLYKQHIMEWLVNTGQAPDMFGEFYMKTFKNGGICDIDSIKYIDVFKAVRAIKEAGGLAVLAHPAQQKNFRIVPELIKYKIDGLELNHHSCDPIGRETILDFAKRYGLFLTGGSDYHGINEPQPFGIGDFLSEESGMNALL